MTSITKQIYDAIEGDIIVRTALERKIISLKNLALYLIKAYHIDASADAVISAIRRYKEDDELPQHFVTARKIIGRSEDIRVTTNIILAAFKKNTEVQNHLMNVFSKVDFGHSDLLLINQGEDTVKLIFNKKNKEKIVEQFPRKYLIHLEEDIAEINIQLHKDAVRTPGIVSTLSTELMLHGINVVELMSCVPEMLFFVKQKDVVKAYNVLFKLCKME